MKPWKSGALALVAAIVWTFVAKQCGDTWLRSKEADHYEQKLHHDKCIAARVLFFEECLRLVAQRPECEVMWAQKQGRVFDAPPDKPWADEIDCSKEIP